MSLPQLDTQDLNTLLASKGLKNLESFKVKAILSRAKRTAEAILKIEPAKGYQYLGLIDAYSNDYDLSINNFKKAILLTPNDFQLLANYALVLNSSGNITESLKYNLRALELNPFESKLFRRLNHFSSWYLYPEYQEKSFLTYKGELDQISDNPIPLENTNEFLDLLKERDIDIELFRKQLILANTICNSFYQSDNLHLMSEVNPEYGYISRVLYMKNAEPEDVVYLNTLYEKEIYKWLEEQEDGGFSLAEKLDDLILYFSIA